MELRDIFSSNKPVRISPDATVGDALVSMMENKTDYLLVDRRTGNDAYGVITRWDIVSGPVAHGQDLSAVPVLECARKPLVVLNNLSLDVRWVAKKMHAEKVSKIAVFDKEEFVGFVSDIDILKAVSRPKGGKGDREVAR
jgi:CBS domain-containing protein